MNLDLQDQALRERISKLEAEMRFLYKHLGVTFVAGAYFDLDPADKEVAEWLKKGDIMKAIVSYRSIHNVGLAEAKAAVDEIKAGLGV